MYREGLAVLSVAVVMSGAAQAGIAGYMPGHVGDFRIQYAEDISAKEEPGVCSLSIEGTNSIGSRLYYRKRTARAPVGTPNDNWRGKRVGTRGKAEGARICSGERLVRPTMSSDHL
jgi:hypothetical protein